MTHLMGIGDERKMKLKGVLAKYLYNRLDFPIEVSDGLDLNWMLKDACPCCIKQPLECLSNYEYRKKYPAKNKLELGYTTVYLCDNHLKELRKTLNDYL